MSLLVVQEIQTISSEMAAVSRVDQFIKDLTQLIDQYRVIGALYVPYTVTDGGGIKCRLVMRDEEKVVELSAEEKTDLDTKLTAKGFSGEGGHLSLTRHSVITAIKELQQRIQLRTVGITVLSIKMLEIIARPDPSTVQECARYQTNIKEFADEIAYYRHVVSDLSEQLLNGMRV